jgi:hypothetical protein
MRPCTRQRCAVSRAPGLSRSRCPDIPGYSCCRSAACLQDYNTIRDWHAYGLLDAANTACLRQAWGRELGLGKEAPEPPHGGGPALRDSHGCEPVVGQEGGTEPPPGRRHIPRRARARRCHQVAQETLPALTTSHAVLDLVFAGSSPQGSSRVLPRRIRLPFRSRERRCPCVGACAKCAR